MLELYCNFFIKFCDTDKYEELEMDTNSPYLALSEENLEDVILPKKRAEWDQLRSEDCTDKFTANATDNSFPRTCCNAHNEQDRREPDLSKEKFRSCCVSVAKHNVVMISVLTSTSSAAKASIEEHWKTVDMDQCQSIAKC